MSNKDSEYKLNLLSITETRNSLKLLSKFLKKLSQLTFLISKIFNEKKIEKILRRGGSCKKYGFKGLSSLEIKAFILFYKTGLVKSLKESKYVWMNDFNVRKEYVRYYKRLLKANAKVYKEEIEILFGKEFGFN